MSRCLTTTYLFLLLTLSTAQSQEGVEEAKPQAADTKFSIDRGFFDEPFTVEITTATPDAEIFYTINGSEPGSVFTGRRYDGTGIRIESTTVLRAQARKSGLEPSNIDTHTYIFPGDVVNQPDEPAGFSTAWQGSDYGMDQDPDHLPLIAGDPALTPEEAKGVIANALKALPSLSLVMEHKDLFGAAKGIYHHTQGRGTEWERPVSVELLHPDGSEGFQIDAGIRMQGFTSRDPGRNPKHSLRLVFRKIYGARKLDYPLFGPDAAAEFDTLVLRSNSQDAWVYDATSNRVGQFVRDEWARRAQLALGRPAPHGTWVHLYLNGLYWGVYNPTERPDSSFMESYFGADKDNYDILKNHEEVIDGTGDAYEEALSLIQNDAARFSAGYLDLTSDEAYAAAARYVDTANLIDYLIPNMYAAATDWPGNNYIGRHRDPQSDGFKFFSWDNEHGMKHGVSENRVLPHRRDEDSPTKFHHAMAANAEYRMQFADQLHRAFFNGGPLDVDPDRPEWDPDHPERNRPAALWMRLTSEIEEALIAESARWGDYRRTVPYTVNKEFRELRADLLENWFPRRSGIVLDQFRDRDLYPKLHAPVFNQHGGHVDAGFRLSMSSKSATVFLPRARLVYTLDGSDPRLPGGGLNPNAIETDITPISLATTTTVKARVENAGAWSALNEALFIVGAQPASPANLLISAIHYHPSPPTGAETEAGFNESADFEYLELHNPSDETVSLHHLRLLGGVRFDFNNDGTAQELAAGASVRLVNNLPAYQSRHGASIPVLGEYQGKLANSGETLVILNASGDTVLELTYDDGQGWPAEADGSGPALVLSDPAPHVDLSDPASWTLSSGGNDPEEDLPWEAWLQTQNDAEPLALFKETGLPHLAAYYLAADLSPHEAAVQITIVDSDTVELRFRRRLLAREAFRYEIETSHDLITWQSAEILTETATTPDGHGALTEQLATRLRPQAPFLRLKIHGP